MNHFNNLIFLAFAVSVLTSCATTGARSPQEKRQAVQEMRSDVMNDLYKIKPQVRSMIGSAPGYGVFSNANVNIIFASFGGGYGVVKDNRTGKDTYMKMGEVGIGLGLGVKDFRVVLIFHDAATMNNFIESGWQLGGQVDAAAVADDKGVGAVGGEIVVDNITIYQLTKTGLALQATVKGTKFWKDGELN